MPLPPKYNSKYHDAWAWSLAARGCTMQEIADAMSVSRQTLYEWMGKKNHDGERELTPFGEAIQTGREVADAHVEKRLYDLCMGVPREETHQMVSINDDGQPVPSRKMRIVKKNGMPDIKAITFWLSNRRAVEWRQKQDVNLNATVGDDDEGVMIYLPNNGRDTVDD